MDMNEFHAALDQLAKPEHTVGAVIKTGPFCISGNTYIGAEPWLLPVSIDHLGRLWVDRDGAMTCVLDTRPHKQPV